MAVRFMGTKQGMTKKHAMVGPKRGHGLVSITRADTLESSRFMGKKPMNAGHERPEMFHEDAMCKGHHGGKGK